MPGSTTNAGRSHSTASLHSYLPAKSSDSMWSGVVIPLLLVVLILSDAPVETQSTNFSFPVFTPQNIVNLLQDGDTAYNQDNASYQLNAGTMTGPRGYSCSRLVYKDKVSMVDKASGTVASFNTSFTFSYHTPKDLNSSKCGDGLVFTFGASANLSHTEISQYPGSGFCLVDFFHQNSSNGGFAVEFDSYNNNPYCFDSSDSHIGVDLNNTSVGSYNLCQGGQDQCSYFCGDKGDFTAWIDYDGAEETLEVRFVNGSSGVQRPRNATFMVHNLQLYELLDEYMYVGFTGSTGQAHELHRITSWEFSSTMTKFPRRAPLLGMQPPSVSPKRISTLVPASIGAVVSLLLLGFLFARYRMRGSSNEQDNSGLVDPSLSLCKFTYNELCKATKNFNKSELLGRGGFGAVYKGTLPSGALLAVKRMRMESNHGQESFQAEVASLSRIRHRNLVQLRGWCHEEEQLLLVFDYMSHGSLYEWLFHFSKRNEAAGSSSLNGYQLALPLMMRRSILSGVATGLSYLHEGCTECVLHRDIKSSNVLLDGDWNAYLGDFGLARVFDHQKMEKTTMMAGTFGYMAPEMPHTGKATKEADVYSFGVLMLESMCGMPPLDTGASEPGEGTLVDKVWRAHEAGNILEVADSSLGSFLRAPDAMNSRSHNESELQSEAPAISSSHISDVDTSTVIAPVDATDDKKMIANLLQLGLVCCDPNPEDRPSMRLVSHLLVQTSESMEMSMPPLPICKPRGNYSKPGFSQFARQGSSQSATSASFDVSSGKTTMSQTSLVPSSSSSRSGN